MGRNASAQLTARVTAVAPTPRSSRRLQLLLLLTASAAPLYGRSTLNPLQEAMRVALGWNDNRMAMLQGPALALPMVIASLPVGLIVDRYSRVRLLVLLATMTVVSSALTAVTSSFTVMFVARSLVGVAIPASGAALFSLVADLYPPEERGRASIAVVVGQYLGIAAAFALGGMLLSSGLTHHSWRGAYLWMAVPLGIVPIILLALREPPRAERILQNPSARDTCREIARYAGEIGPLIAGLTLLQIAMQSTFAWAAPVFYREFSLAPGDVGMYLAVGFLGSGVVGSVAGGFLADLAQSAGGPRSTATVLCGLAVLCAPMMAFAVMPTMLSASLLLAMFLTAVCALEVAGTTLITVIVPNELRGTCVAALAANVMVFGIGLGPILVSYLSGVIGGSAFIGRALTLIGTAACMLGALALALARRSLAARPTSVA